MQAPAFNEQVIAIFAFATTTSVETVSKFSVTCSGSDRNEVSVSKTVDVIYPFRLYSCRFTVPVCNTSANPREVGPEGDFSTSAQLYVAVGVLALLYSLGAAVVYVCFDEKYRKYDAIPVIDFCISLCYTFLWTLASCLWAKAVKNIQHNLNPVNMWHSGESGVTECEYNYALKHGIVCSVDEKGNFAGLNVSIIFGFLNALVWGCNLYFLFKETKWFKKNGRPENFIN
ncbi:hypothetical protein CAPTEDRAFT_209649 [Capitella teleta]|uniref:MARVEL domain-containing protein n=1 Tax=Capitella teleta TaxID=283909 RepID=R7TBQ5_CAPTE|nr:hypothetical protein CAPTEDRAFT_209649 [Capitella teleta]|eukprot:ELT88531.1 hypothetical protein CAPTEDRAFT_209649 [Capitella teleta]